LLDSVQGVLADAWLYKIKSFHGLDQHAEAVAAMQCAESLLEVQQNVELSKVKHRLQQLGDAQGQSPDQEGSAAAPNSSVEMICEHDWTQSMSEVTITVDFPTNIKHQDVTVEFRSNICMLTVLGATANICRELYDLINTDQSLWLWEGQQLTIVLEKRQRRIWKALFADEDEISIGQAMRQVVAEDPYSGGGFDDLSEDAKKIVTLTRNLKHARAIGDEGLAIDIEEDLARMKMVW